jgi:hypothetical protein
VGLIGAPLLLAADVAVFFGVLDRMATVNALAALPVALWEFSLGVYLTVKGFRPSSPLLAAPGPAVDRAVPVPTQRTGEEHIGGRGAAIG